MKCPKCGFFGPDHLDTCKKCGKDLTAEKARLGLNRPRTMRVHDRQAPASSPSEDVSLAGQDSSSRSEPTQASAPRTERLVPPLVSPPAPAPEPSSAPKRAPAVSAAEESPISLDDTEDFGGSADEEPLEAPEKTSPRAVETHVDDFEFPDFTKTESISERTDLENQSFSGFSLTDSEKEETSRLSDTAEAGGFALSDIGGASISPPDSDLAFSETEQPPALEAADRGAAKTRLLSAQEIENILHSELPPPPARPDPKITDKAKTQLLDEDQLSDILGELDNDPSRPE